MSFGFGVSDFIAAIQLANKIRKEFADAPSQFKDISDEVRSLSIILQDIDVVMSEPDLNTQQKNELKVIADGCLNVLEKLEQTLDKYSEPKSGPRSVGGRVKRVWKRFRWEPEDIKELRNRISTNVSLLSAFNGRLTRDNVVTLVRHQEDQGRQTVLDWITPIDYAPQQNDFIARRQEGTGQWLLDSVKFQTWLETDKQTLFCPGIPGAGKTILTSIVVEELNTRFYNDKSIGIAYLYCNFRRQDEQKIDDLLAALLKQLAECQPFLQSSVKGLYDQHKTKRTRPSLDEISRSLQSVVATYSRVFIIIDALDECQVSHGCRTTFLLEMFGLQAKYGANLFVTSRYIPEILENFKGSIWLEIRASKGDVQTYLDYHISPRRAFLRKNLELQQEIKAKIVDAVHGMFLLAQLHLDSLMGKTTESDVRSALENLPTGSNAYDQAYKDAMERITAQDVDGGRLAKQVLSWITCAKRPLSTVELQHAIAVEPGKSEFDEKRQPDIEDIVSVCAGLVTVDEESNIIRLVHYTTQEYFERTQNYWFPNIEADISIICVTYLSFDVFERSFCQTDEEFEERLRSNQFFEYATRNWGHHACKASSLSQVLNQAIVDFLNSEAKINASSQGLLAVKRHFSHLNYSQDVPRRITGLHLTAYFGVKAIVKLLLETGKVDVNSKDSWGLTPLWWAAQNGHEAAVKLLLETGKVDVDSKDIWGLTPLWWAAQNGHEAVVELLLETGKVNVELKDRDSQTPLLWAAQNGHEAVVKLLLEKGKVNVNSKNSWGQTPLWWAAWNRHEAVVKLLLDTGKVNVDLRDGLGQTPLSIAAWNGYEAVVKLLLETGKVDIISKDIWGQTPLSRAARNRGEAVVKLLLETGKVDIDVN